MSKGPFNQPVDPRGQVRLLVPWARGKCPKCGGTLVVDPLPHRCDPELTSQNRMRGDRETRSAL